MSFTLLLLRVAPGASEDDVERIAISTTETERTRVPGPPEHARHRFHWWTVAGPEEGAGIEITLYDDHVSVKRRSSFWRVR